MRTAFCFSGELRSIDKTYPLLKERIMNRFSNYDIFCHLWDDDPDINKLDILQDDIVGLHVEKRKTFDEKNYAQLKRDEVSIQGMLRQLYCLKRANDLKCDYEKQNDFKYDIVVRIRPDTLVVNSTSLELNPETWDMDNYIYTSDHDDHHGYNDRLYFSNSENMDFLSNRLELLDYYRSLGGVMHYETFFKFCVDYKNLGVCRSNLEFVLLRTNGEMSSDIVVDNLTKERILSEYE